MIPDVSVPDIGDDILKYVYYVERSGFFESAQIVQEDLEKVNYYKQNLQRESVQTSFSNYKDFLKTLEMSSEMTAFTSVGLNRITQLLNKTNQFNLNTVRVDVHEINDIISNQGYISLQGRLKDSFGDNGLVTVIYGKIDGEQVTIENWVMSCRVFKRELEFAIFNQFVNECRKKKIKSIKAYYLPTKKNKIVADLYEKLGFCSEDKSLWVLKDLSEYKVFDHAIEIES